MQKLTTATQGILVPDGVQRTPLKLTNGVRNLFLTIIGRARVVVSVAAATAVRNRGSVFALAEEIRLVENAKEKTVVTGKVLRFASEMNAPSALTAARLSQYALANGTLPVGTYLLEEAVRMHFAFPLSGNPLETAFIERDVRQALALVIKQVADTDAALATAGPATVVVDQVAFTVLQGYEEPSGKGIKAPLFLSAISEQTEEITGAGVKKIPILVTNPMRMIVLSQEVDGLEVSDIINSAGLRGQFREIIGDTDWDDLLLNSEFDYGGAVMTSNRSHFGVNFQRYGQLSEALNQVQDLNLRWELDCQPSATAGTSIVRTTIFELVRDPAVTAPEIPFPI